MVGDRQSNPRFRSAARKGSTIMEIGIATIVLGIALAFVAQTTVIVAHQNRELERRTIATIEISNLMEMLTSLAWDELDDDAVKDLKLSSDTDLLLPGAKLAGSIYVREGEITAKRIELSIQWSRTAGLQDSVRLVAWKYSPSLNDTP